MVSHLLPIASNFVWIVLYVQRFVLLTNPYCLLVWKKMFFARDIRGRGGHFDRCCFDIFPDFETYLHRDFEFQSGKKISASVDWSSNVCFFEVELQHIVTCIPECWWNCLCLENTCDGLIVCQNKCWLCSPQNVCKLEKCHVKCQKLLLKKWTFWVARGRKSLSQTPPGRTFSVLTIFWSGLPSVMTAYPALLKLASVIKLLSRNGLFQCWFASVIESFIDWIKYFLQFWRNIDWHFRFKQFVEGIKFFSHAGIKISVTVHESQVSL